MVHTGKIIKNYLDNNGITVKEFAYSIHRSISATYKILDSDSVSVSLLHIISYALKHNFFHAIGKIIEDNNKDNFQ